MKPQKIKLYELENVVNTFNDQGFNYPDTYKLKFPVIQFCRYCKRLYVTKTIHVFEDVDSGKTICCCTKCGGRHRITLKTLQETKTSYKVIGICLFLILAFLFLLASL